MIGFSQKHFRAFNAYRRPGFDSDSLSFVDARMSRDREEILVMRKSRVSTYVWHKNCEKYCNFGDIFSSRCLLSK